MLRLLSEASRPWASRSVARLDATCVPPTPVLLSASTRHASGKAMSVWLGSCASRLISKKLRCACTAATRSHPLPVALLTAHPFWTPRSIANFYFQKASQDTARKRSMASNAEYQRIWNLPPADMTLEQFTRIWHPDNGHHYARVLTVGNEGQARIRPASQNV